MNLLIRVEVTRSTLTEDATAPSDEDGQRRRPLPSGESGSQERQ